MNKIVFEENFNKSNGQPFIYKGKELKLSDRINMPSNKIALIVTFVSTDSKWRQGIVLQTKGEFEINGQKIFNKIVLWEDTAPKQVETIVKSKDNILFVFNVWNTGDETMHYGHNGGALNVEDVGGIRIYYCNDGYPDDDLNDLVFKLEFKRYN
jgi:hypothetical protein